MEKPAWRWWTALSRISEQPGQVHTWCDSRHWPSIGKGHLHPNPTAIVCLADVVRIIGTDQQVDLLQGDVLVLAAGVWHQHMPLRPEAAWFGQGVLPAWADATIVAPDVHWTGKLPLQPAERLLRAVLAATEGRRRAAAASWLRHVVEERSQPLDHHQPILEPMVELMWRRFHIGITVAELVRVSGASRSAAYANFTRWYGMPPREAIISCRLMLAEELLRQDLPVAEVAWRCGFGNPDSFTRCWRKRHGKSPREWRRPAQDA